MMGAGKSKRKHGNGSLKLSKGVKVDIKEKDLPI